MKAKSCFGDDDMYLEKLILNPKHIEFQIMADSFGNVVHLGERDCSIQRRNQKMIEEAPSTALTPELRERMGRDAVRAARAAGYENAGTIEYVLDQEGNYYFIEMNTRIQVEHPVTEMITGIDLIKEQITIAEGRPLSFRQEDVTLRGQAIRVPDQCGKSKREFSSLPWHGESNQSSRWFGCAGGYCSLPRLSDSIVLRFHGGQSNCIRQHPR